MGGWSVRGIPACRAGLLFLRGRRGQPPFFPGGVGVFSAPLEKTEIFLTAPGGRNHAALSGLSDERSRRKSLREEFRPRWQNSGVPEQLEIPRF